MSDAVRPWRPPSIERAPEAGGGIVPAGAALLGGGTGAGDGPDGPPDGGPQGRARRWHEAHDAAGLTALLGGRRPVRVPDGAIEVDGRPDDGAPDGAGNGDGTGNGGGDADAAFDAGFAAGEAAAREAMRDGAGGAAAERLEALAHAFARETRLAGAALEAELAALAREMAACAVGRELRGDPDLFAALAREALAPLEALDGEAPVTVRLHPEDAAAVDGRLGPDVRVVPDAALRRSDCRLERGAARVDAGVRARLEAVCAEAEEVGLDEVVGPDGASEDAASDADEVPADVAARTRDGAEDAPGDAPGDASEDAPDGSADAS